MARIAADPSPIESRLHNLRNFWEINAEKEREEA
uniref:Transcriptional regulator n=3 Tax=Bursaphelenchus xylophilus TaxID=6326 RepID=A0A1I7SHS2_BURXY